MNVQRHHDIDEAWMQEWVLAGLHELERYLQKQAAFEEYCRSRRHPRPAGA
jgi:hypothetical protein